MFGEKTLASSNITGTGAYTLDAAVGSFKSWRSQFADLSQVFYCAENSDGTIWEIGYGTLTYSSPDTVARTLIASSTGSLIVWVLADAPIYVYSAPTAAALTHLIKGGINTTRPAWLQAGGQWLDYTLGLGVTWVKNRWTGTVNMEDGRYDIAAGIFTPSPRNKWIDNGAAGLTMAATHVGQAILFDCSAAARTFTALAGATAGIGHGFTVWVLGYGSTTNGVVLAPNGSEKIDQGAASASLTIPPNRLTRLSWDGVKLQWRTDYLPAPAYAGVRQTVAAGPVDTAGLPSFLPATSASLTLTGQNVTSSAPLVAASAAGWSVTGQPIDYVGSSTANPVWTGLAANRAASTPNFIYATIAAGVFSYASTTVAPVYQWGGTPAVTSGQITFNISEMKCYLGNGVTAPQAALVIFGEAATDATTVISTVAYAYNGRYQSAFTATLPAIGTFTSANHNIGVVPQFRKFAIRCNTIDRGYAVGDVLMNDDLGAYDTNPNEIPLAIMTTSKLIGITSGSSQAFNAMTKTTGTVVGTLTLASWDYQFIASRQW